MDSLHTNHNKLVMNKVCYIVAERQGDSVSNMIQQCEVLTLTSATPPVSIQC